MSLPECESANAPNFRRRKRKGRRKNSQFAWERLIGSSWRNPGEAYSGKNRSAGCRNASVKRYELKASAFVGRVGFKDIVGTPIIETGGNLRVLGPQEWSVFGPPILQP